jgi:cholesterol oxidase
MNDVMPWFAQGVEAGNGVLALKRPWWFFGSRRFHLSWDVTKSLPVFNTIVDMHKKLSAATGGVAGPAHLDRRTRSCHSPSSRRMQYGDTPDNGVVDHKGEYLVIGNLYVADGAIIPRRSA